MSCSGTILWHGDHTAIHSVLTPEPSSAPPPPHSSLIRQSPVDLPPEQPFGLPSPPAPPPVPMATTQPSPFLSYYAPPPAPQSGSEPSAWNHATPLFKNHFRIKHTFGLVRGALHGPAPPTPPAIVAPPPPLLLSECDLSPGHSLSAQDLCTAVASPITPASRTSCPLQQQQLGLL